MPLEINVGSPLIDQECVKSLFSDICELLKMVYIVESCEYSGDLLKLSFSEESLKARFVYHFVEKNPSRIVISLDYIEEGRPKAAIPEFWLSLEGGRLIVDYRLEAGLMLRSRIARSLELGFKSLEKTLSIVCRQKAKEEVKEEKPPAIPRAEPVKSVEKPVETPRPPPAPTPSRLEYDLSDPRLRANLLKKSSGFKILDPGVELGGLVRRELGSGSWLLVETFPGGRKYMLYVDGILKGLYCENVCEGSVLVRIAYSIVL
ncbi:hypothetical protein ACSU1N_07015 [Thermogladius sp. 4427co]|uniref:hypothetical protein n=1 Tax=Thermogladius sp. 4427co TaxID=3450718 RepID=UPI003F78CF45